MPLSKIFKYYIKKNFNSINFLKYKFINIGSYTGLNQHQISKASLLFKVLYPIVKSKTLVIIIIGFI